jgi:histidyl-tRNA synthetase
MADIPFPRGVRDLMPNEALFRNELLEKVENTFKLFGFLTIDTPSFESLEVLKAKNAIGSDTKLIYELKDEKLGLRYDHTISLARYMAMHQELPMPFKRYYIGKSWRREEPQRLRYREITQADADIIGGAKSVADAEVIGVAASVLDSIGIDYIICINDRSITDSMLGKFGVNKEIHMDVMRALDKLDKIGETGVVDILKGLNLEDATVDQVVSFITLKGTNDEKLSYVDNILRSGEQTKDIRMTISLLEFYGITGETRVEFSIVRGLDYYTGIIFEYKNRSDQSVSIGGGGRYDNLIGLYSNKPMPAVGASLGIDRILEMLDFSSSTEYTYAKLFVANVNENNYPYAVKLANQFRARGIPTEINMATRNLSKQFAYANAIKAKYVAVVGDAEEKIGQLKLRNLIDGKEAVMFIDEAVKIINGN